MRPSHRKPDRAATSRSLGWPAVCLFLIAACTPTFDWRENSAPGTGITTTFPCRPDRHARRVEVAGRGVEMQMLVCSAGDATFAVGFYDAADPAQVGAGLVALRAGLLANVADPSPRVQPARIRGMTPNAEATQLTAHGRRTDGRALELRAAVFTRGLRVYQAAVVGSTLPDESTEPFFAGLRFGE